MKSSLKISVSAIGLISAVLMSAAASSAADKIAPVDYLVDSPVDYLIEDEQTMAGQTDFLEEIINETAGEEADEELENGFEFLEASDDKDLRPDESKISSASSQASSKPESSSSKLPSSSQKPSSAPSSSKEPSSSAPSSSKESSSSKKPSSSESSEQSSSEQSSSQTKPVVSPNVNSNMGKLSPTFTDSNGNEILRFYGNGKLYKLPVKEALKRVVSSELDGNFSYEAIKAQVVATHTYIKYYNDMGKNASIGIKSSYKVGGKIDKAVEEVYDVVMTYNGRAIFSPYFASSCGSTQASKEVWGGTLAYLVAADSRYDYLADYDNLATSKIEQKTKIKSQFLATKKISEETVKSKIQSKLGVTPTGDPSTWFKFLDASQGGVTSGGYVGKISVCGKTTSGKNVRGYFGLRSAAFTVSYNDGTFTFTTKGYGHGVGLSQWGAHFFAALEGWNYQQILSHYFKGIKFACVS